MSAGRDCLEPLRGAAPGRAFSCKAKSHWRESRWKRDGDDRLAAIISVRYLLVLFGSTGARLTKSSILLAKAMGFTRGWDWH